ncbi:MAG: hypothetical protein NC251_12230 [Lachnoclostridium sp.]|nr:hypothetical protein [Lachnospira sp.]MCM1249181.1 hypothetical protein [Lachnoclostridium sp.]
MDISPLYELRARLRAAMLAGTNLLSEDFRLKRAVEAFAPLESASPVFGKIGQLVKELLQPEQADKEGALLDAITLVDAVLCTQGAVSVEGDVEPILEKENAGGSVVINAPYSVLKSLLDALLSSGSGHYGYVVDTHERHPELFSDYRVKAAMVQALGASYGELADLVAGWLKEEGAEILPLLQKGFDPKGKKEMVRRIQVMEAIDTDVINGETKSNAFYVNALSEAEKEVRQSLIYALRYSPVNTDLLLELVKTEKGNAKKMAYYALACMEDEKAEAAFREYYKKSPTEALGYLVYVETKWASRFVAEILKEQLTQWAEAGKAAKSAENGMTKEQADLLEAALLALPGKSGPEICEAITMAEEMEEEFERIKIGNLLGWKGNLPRFEINRDLRSSGPAYDASRVPVLLHSFDESIPCLLHQALYINPQKELCELAIKLYEAEGDKQKDYFPAAVMAMLLTRDDICDWLEEQLTVKKLVWSGRDEVLYPLLARGLDGLKFDERKKEYKYSFSNHCYRHPSGEPLPKIEHSIKQEVKGRFMDILISCSDTTVDMILGSCIDASDEACCQKLGDHFYKQALAAASVIHNRPYINFLNRCKYSKCEGLAVSYFKKRQQFYVTEIPDYIRILPGSDADRYNEAQAIYELYKKGQLKVRSSSWNDEKMQEFMEEIKPR